MRRRSLTQFLDHYLRRPALLVDYEVTKNIKPVSPAEVDQAHGVKYPDWPDSCRVPCHGSMYWRSALIRKVHALFPFAGQAGRVCLMAGLLVIW